MPIPRVLPATPRVMGLRNTVMTWFYARRLGVSGLPNVFTTLARDRRLFRPYMAFAYPLMRGSSLALEDTELLICRTAMNMGSEYEWHHHSQMAQRAGLTEEEVDRIKEGWQASGWSAKRADLLRAADELHTDHCLSDETWNRLSARLSHTQIAEICLLVGNYVMVAMFLRTMRVQIEDGQ
jgi:alkylhydroperoxidase family enzyme